MERTKFPVHRTQTKFKKSKIKFLRRNCPPRGKTWTDPDGKVHRGLLIRHLRKAKAKGYKKLIFISPETNDKTIFTFKQ